MRSKRFSWVAVLVLAGLTGCAMCDNSQDCSYPAFGGKWQRDNPFSGRVGSLFDPAGIHISEQMTLTEEGPTLAEPEAPEPEPAETVEGPETAESAEPSEDVKPTEGPEPTEAPAAMPESTLEKLLEQTPPARDEAETMPETAEKTESGKEAKPAEDQDVPEADLQLPAMPDEMPKTEKTKDGGTNLLPPLELPPVP